MANLDQIRQRADAGYFLNEDMEALGLSGYVSLHDVRLALGPKIVNPPVDYAAVVRQANEERLQESLVRAKEEAARHEEWLTTAQQVDQERMTPIQVQAAVDRFIANQKAAAELLAERERIAKANYIVHGKSS